MPPVLTGTGDIQLHGVDQSLVGTVNRPDGSKQVTLNGWPLYRDAEDTVPGNAKGQDKGGAWFAVTPQGNKATAHASTGSGSGNDGGYSGGSYGGY